MLSYLVPLFVFLCLAGAGTDFVYRRRLRAVDPELANRLHPGFARKSIATDLAATSFLLRGEFRKLDDPSFIRFSEFYRALTLIAYVVFLATVVAFAIAV